MEISKIQLKHDELSGSTGSSCSLDHVRDCKCLNKDSASWTYCVSCSHFPLFVYKVVQIWPGQTVTCLHTNSPGHIWTTLYYMVRARSTCYSQLLISLRTIHSNINTYTVFQCVILQSLLALIIVIVFYCHFFFVLVQQFHNRNYSIYDVIGQNGVVLFLRYSFSDILV